MTADPDALWSLLGTADPGQTLLIHDDVPLSVGGFVQEVGRVAAALRAHGVSRGDVVAVWLPSGPAWLATLFACGRIGATVLALNTAFRAAELQDLLARSGAAALVFAPGSGSPAQAGIVDALPAGLLGALRCVIAVGGGGRAPREIAFEALPPADVDPADDGGSADGVILFPTSGTTRRPKLVLHVQRSLATHARDVARALGYGEAGAAVLSLHPLCGVLGLTQALASLAGGAPLVLLSRVEPHAAAEAIGRYRVTGLVTVDVLLGKLLDANGGAGFPSLRVSSFGSYDGSAFEFARDRAEPAGLTVVGCYGMSEVQALIALRDPGAPLEERAKAGGRLVARGGAVRARDPATGELLPPGEVGELEFRCPSLMDRYLGDADATARAFTPDGFLRSGDLGRVDGERSFEFLGRAADTLRLGGFLVNPLEISDVVAEHPSVAEAVAVAIRQGTRTRPFAFVVLRPGHALNPAALIEHCAARLARFKVPVGFIALDAFPTAVGPNGTKVQREALRAMAEAQTDA